MVKARPRPAVNGVASADRVLTVLTAFRIGDSALSLVELVERTGLIKSTIMRLMVSLENHGFITRMADGRYQLASEVMRLNAVYQETLDLERHVMPRLHHLAEQSGETASFYVRHGAYRMCQYRVNSSHSLRLNLQPGDMRPMDEAAGAQALRAPYQIGIALHKPYYSKGATDPHAASMALPIYGAQHELMGALVISGPASRLTEQYAESLRQMFFEAARDLMRSLGFKPANLEPESVQ
ncbi:helix-turn-helix domain-containing protein [Pseudomonas monteilii]|jgi:DNA-binding IclR family transcriptional regulator|nr:MULTISPECIES: helix-turn-helix domain-containing protein [Pseudomonas]MBH3454343.1 helix-turn-helix domain-containing protein [Pseudomonas monteilii]MCJ7850497.1 helix-turn-helix domain-containing protein [Pseudomonas monteilii]MDD2124570.1 helix-turn-helix domain-containing protein [Pseudomonas monteilii]MDI3371447.1 helix-turn-helix domain-containing protein [Pseudomonas sp. V104_10]PXX60639.1 IclR family transcriptional regulator [Pseudomonas sp. LAIL14HWK12:I1]